VTDAGLRTPISVLSRSAWRSRTNSPATQRQSGATLTPLTSPVSGAQAENRSAAATPDSNDRRCAIVSTPVSRAIQSGIFPRSSMVSNIILPYLSMTSPNESATTSTWASSAPKPSRGSSASINQLSEKAESVGPLTSKRPVPAAGTTGPIPQGGSSSYTRRLSGCRSRLSGWLGGRIFTGTRR